MEVPKSVVNKETSMQGMMACNNNNMHNPIKIKDVGREMNRLGLRGEPAP